MSSTWSPLKTVWSLLMMPVGLQLLLGVMEVFGKKSPVCFVISLQFSMGLDFTQQLKT